MPAPILPIFDVPDYAAEIQRAADRLASGQIIVVPTETVYGSAGIVTNPKTIERLKILRKINENRPFTLHIASREAALQYIGGSPGDLANRMMRKLWPGPVGLRFDVKEETRQAVAKKFGFNAGDIYDDQGRITLRFPDHPVASAIIAAVKAPVVLTAARAAYRVEDLGNAIDEVDLVLDAGPTRYSKPSTLVHVTGNKYEIVRPGVYDERIIERMLKTTILFICSGNTCRSPMSEALARKIIATKLKVPESELEKKGINVISAGAFAMPGARATPQAVEAVRNLGADLSRHRSRALTVELIHQADAIFTMGRSHLEAVLALVPSARDKVSLLKPGSEVDDPIGADVGVYQQLAGELEKLIEARLRETEGVLP